MTEKRFTELISSFDYYTIWDNKEDKGLTVEDAVDLLNELNDENEKLKSELVESKKAHSNCDKLWWELYDEKEQLEKENEQLKSICQDHRDHAIDFKADCVRLEKENWQLKSENNMLKVTIGRNEAYIKKLTETSEWHC